VSDVTPIAASDHEPRAAAAPAPPKLSFRIAQRLARVPVLGSLLRFGAWWLGLSGMLAAFTVCPCCGMPGCATGATGLGLVGALGVTLLRRLGFRRNRPPRTDPANPPAAE
jgi:hypothetical protein